MGRKKKGEELGETQLLHINVPKKDLEVLDTKLNGRERTVVVRRLISDYIRGRIQIDWSHD